MKRALKPKLSAGLVLCSGLLVSVIGSSAPLQNPNPPQNPTEKSATLIVKLKQGMSEAARQATVQRHGGTRKHSFSQLGLEVVEMPEGKVAAFIKNAKDDPDLVRVEVNHTRKLQSLPSDTLIADQWALPKIGWDQVYGSVFPSSTAEVAILDTGIDPTHPDLVGAIAPGASMIDDSAGMTDPNGHGTWLAGIVAGRTDNAVGIAGVAYSQVRVQPVKVLDANGEGQDSDIINGVLWATDHGASVILMAFSDTGFSPALQEAIDYAWSRGVVLVAAAGNDASNVATFPAGDKGVIGVSATDPNDELSLTSNYGSSVFLAAPGVSIESTYLNSGYVTFSGTSASAAIVAGTAAMMRAIDPTLANGVVVSRMARTADPAGTLEQTGNGRVNMARAIADSSIDEIEPLGAPPVGGAGPFVGPYRAAASTLTSVTVTAQSGVLTYGTSGSVNYTVTVNRGGNGSLNVILGPTASPLTGTTWTFSPSTVSFNGIGNAIDSLTSTLTITTVSTTPAGSNAFTVTAADGGNIKTAPGSLVIAAKPVTGSFTVSSKTYDGNTSGAVLTRSLSGVFAGDASNVSLTGGTAAFVDASVANNKTVTLTGATLTGTAAGNYSLTSVNPATANITPLGIIGKFTASNKTFDATNSASVLTRSLQGVLSGDVSNVSLSGGTATFADSSPGTGKAVTLADAILSGTASANYSLTSVNTTTADITKANATISVTPYSLTYDSTSHTATGTASGVAGANLSGQLTLTGTTHTNAGDYPADAWSFAGGANYNDANGTVHDSIGKAIASIVVNPYDVAYDANPHTATGTASGVAGLNLSASLTLTATTHTNAGDYPADAWSFAGGTNYNDANGTTHNIIDRASATIVVTPYHVTYDANAHTAAGTATGVAGVNLGASLTLTATTHTNAGDYPADAWSFSGGTNYNDANGAVHNIIDKANATIVVTPYHVTYDANAHTATGTATGVAGVNLGASLTLTGTTHANAGDYPADAWSFAGDTNYNDANGTTHNIIDKANAAVNVTGFTGMYDATSHGASATIAGVAGDSLAAGSSFNPGSSFTNVPGGFANWTFTGGTNYNDQNGTVEIVISKATAAFAVTGYHVSYDGNAHTATGTATGVAGADLSGSLTLSATTHTSSGDYSTDGWSFAGGTNYNDASGTVHDIIDRSNASIVVTPYSVNYDGLAHTATGTVKGVQGETLSGLDLSGTSHTNAGSYPADSWIFTDVTGNYFNASGTTNDSIAKIHATITVNGFNGPYDASAHGASGTATGAGGENLSSQLHLGATFTNGPGGNAHWVFAGGTNYLDDSGDVAVVINKIPASINVIAYDGLYDGASHGASGTATGLGGLTLGGLLHVGTATFMNVPGGTVAWTFDGDSNYNADGGSVDVKIVKTHATITIQGFNGSYDGAAHGAIASVSGAGGENLIGQLNAGASFTNVPGGTAHWAFTGGINYVDESGDVGIVITRAASTTTTVGGGPITFDATSHAGGSGTVTGAGGLSTTATSLTYSGDQVNSGTYYVTAHYSGDGNHEASDGAAIGIVIGRAASTTVTSGAGPFTYDGSTHAGGSGTVTGAGGLSTTATSLTYSGDQVNSGTYYVTAHYSGDANHEASDGAAIGIVIGRAASTTVTSGAGPFTYDGSTHAGGSGTVTGAGGLSTTATSLTYSGDQVNSGTYYVTAHYSGDANHEASDGAAIGIVIDRAASTTVTSGAGPFTYDGSTHTGGSGAVTGTGGLNTGATSLTYTGDQINAGNYTVTAHYVGDANHAPSDGAAVAIVINKGASATTTIGGGPFPYDGSTHAGGSGSVTGAGGLSTSATSLTYSGDQVNSGTYYVTAHFSGDANHEASDGAAIGIVIDRAASTTVTSGAGPFTYDGSTHTGGSGAVTGAGGLNTGATSLTYTGDQVNSGTYYVTAHYSGDANHEASDGAAIGIVIDRAASTTVTSGAGPFAYDGSTHTGGSGAVTGAGGLNTGATSLTYTGDQVNSGTYYVTAHYSGDANHEASDGAAIGIVIDRAASTTVTTGAGPFTYDGSTRTGGSGAVTGTGGLDTGATSLTYTGNQINAGSYAVTAHYAGDANHTPSDGAAVTIVINKAASTTTTIGGGPFTYDGSTHAGGSGSVTGAGGLSTSATSLTYSGDQVNAGSYNVTAHYAGDANHEASHGAAVVILINKATATINITPYHVTYDGSAHTATASATGVGGVDVSAGLNLDGTTHTTAGSYVDSWSFTGGANYSDATGPVSDIIAKANAQVTVNGYSGMYDGNPHGASGSAKGIGGANMNAFLNLGGTFQDVPGGTAHWVFAGGNNYNDQTGDVVIVINKWTVSGFYQPVDMTPAGSPIVWNTVKGGSTVPLKFNIYVGTTEQTSINAIKEIQVFDVMCSTSVIADVPLEFTTTGGTSLRYDTTAHQFIQNWQTPKAAGKCYMARMTAQDGSTISNAFFKTK